MKQVQAHKELAWAKRGAEGQSFELFVFAIILDGNTRVCLHQPMEAQGLTVMNRAQPRARKLYNHS